MSHDKTLQTDVLAELDWEPAVNAAHIGVSAKAGLCKVRMAGTTST